MAVAVTRGVVVTAELGVVVVAPVAVAISAASE